MRRFGRKSRLLCYGTFDPVGLEVRWCIFEWGTGEAAPSERPPCLSAGGSFRVRPSLPNESIPAYPSNFRSHPPVTLLVDRYTLRRAIWLAPLGPGRLRS